MNVREPQQGEIYLLDEERHRIIVVGPDAELGARVIITKIAERYLLKLFAHHWAGLFREIKLLSHAAPEPSVSGLALNPAATKPIPGRRYRNPYGGDFHVAEVGYSQGRVGGRKPARIAVVQFISDGMIQLIPTRCWRWMFSPATVADTLMRIHDEPPRHQ